MPIIEESAYRRRPWYFLNSHFETIIPSVFNKVEGVRYDRERLELSDGDFLDLDWIRKNNRRLIIIGHGLEGSSQRHYVKRAAKYFHHKRWDILAWNNRSCGGELNRLPRLYHHGDTGDLAEVIQLALKGPYDQIILLGISMGGCQTVKYFGEYEVDDRVLGGVTVSVSCDLRDTSIAASTNLGGFYAKRFLNKLKSKIEIKAKHHESLGEIELDKIATFDDYHERVSSKLFDFKDASDFYQKSSCINYFDGIKKPVFILNAKNDPLLGGHCFPYDEVKDHSYIYLETPKYGGHVGFTIPNEEYSYIEVTAEKFIEEVILPNQTS